jgi:hypothetical protein
LPVVETEHAAEQERQNHAHSSVRPRFRQSAASSAAHRTTRAEQETVIRWNRADDLVHLWSASPVTWRKLEGLGIPAGRETRFPGGVVSGRFYTILLSRSAWGLNRAGSAGGCSRVAVRTAAEP